MPWNTSAVRFAASSAGATYALDPATAATSIQIPAAGTFNATYSITVNSPANKTVTIVVTVTNAETNRQITITSHKRLI